MMMEGDSPYVAPVLAQAPRLLSLLDREAHSLTAGSADREYWAWKFRDQPIGMLQTAVQPLALLWAYPFPQNPHFHNPRLLDWILSGFRRTLEQQHTNGSFDGYSPNDQDSGVTLGVIHGLIEAHRTLRERFPAKLESRFMESVRAACDFALHHPESHAFISNHWALFALAFWDAGELLGDERYRRRSREVVARILAEQSSDGWYNEYGGPDPGYETQGISHLAKYWSQTGDGRVLDSLRRSVEFLAHCIHPDGSLGGIYGSRHTALYSPAGFEILAQEVPLAASIAKFMRERLGRGNVVTPPVVDTNNLVPLLTSYLEAALAHRPIDNVPALPCEQTGIVRHFADSAISVAATRAYYAVASARKGGVCRIFDRRTHTVAYEDAGYLVQSGTRRWISQMLGLSHSTPTTDSAARACEAQFAAYEQQLPTPVRFVILRLLNLTLFRSVALGALIRKWIVRLLITGVRPGPLRLRRELTFEEGAVTFHDCIELERPMQVDSVALPRALTGIHMGSAKYFHASELVETPQASVEHMARDLNRTGRAECRFTLKFLSDGGVALQSGDANSIKEVPETVGHTR